MMISGAVHFGIVVGLALLAGFVVAFGAYIALHRTGRNTHKDS